MMSFVAVAVPAVASTTPAVASTNPLPSLATDFYTGALRSDQRSTGPSYDVKDGLCCPVHSLTAFTKCSVQTQQMGSDTYEQGSKDRTRMDSGQGSIVTWYGDIMKQMVLSPSNNGTHKYDCVQMCPINGTFHSTVAIGDQPDPPYSFTKPRHLARPGEFRQPSIVGGQSKVLDRWRWEQKISIVPMAFVTAYVDSSSTPAQIFGIAKKDVALTGWENVSFVGFTPEHAANSSLDQYFDIDPRSIAKCPKAPSGCFPGVGYAPARLTTEDTLGVSTHVARAVREAGHAADDPTPNPKPDPPLPNVTFAADYTATIEQYTISNQNGYTLANGDLCCSYGGAGAPPICAAAIAKTVGVRYFDVTNQRYRYEAADNIPGAAEVADYKSHKHMIVGFRNGTNITECKTYCPIDAHEVLKPHFFGFGNKVVDEGHTTWQAHPAEHYHWVEKADPLPIKLQTVDFYADITKPHAAVPLFKHTAIDPFGIQPIGFFNLTWDHFKAGPPDATKFDIAGADTCKKEPNCGAPPMQDARLAMGMHHTFARYARGGEW